MKLTYRRIAAAHLLAVLLVPVSAYAAAHTLGSDLASIPMADVVATFLLSAVCGMAGLLHELKEEFKAKGQVDHLWLFVAWRVFGSLAAGLFGFFGARWYVLASAPSALTIMGMSFGGTYAIQRVLSWFADKNLPVKPPEAK
jgi:hypothetical protein